MALYGESEDSHAGFSIAPAGDTNNDGYDDLLVGGHMHPDMYVRGGSAYLVTGPITASSSLADATAKVDAEQSYEWLGIQVEGAGDLNGDGALDIAISAPRDYYYGLDDYPGKVYIFSTPLEGGYTGADADLVIQGEGIGDYTGCRHRRRPRHRRRRQPRPAHRRRP